jgi:hypothetical protein
VAIKENREEAGEVLINTPNVDEAHAFRLRPLFKYPSWKYPGEYADK